MKIKMESFLGRYAQEMKEDLDISLKEFYESAMAGQIKNCPSLESIIMNSITNLTKKMEDSISIEGGEGLSMLDSSIIDFDEKKVKSIINRRAYTIKKLWEHFEENLTESDNNEACTVFDGLSINKRMELVEEIVQWKDEITSADYKIRSTRYLTSYPFIKEVDKNGKNLLKWFETDVSFNITKLSNSPKFSNFVQPSPNVMAGTFTGDNLRKTTEYSRSYKEEITAAREEGFPLTYLPKIEDKVNGMDYGVNINFTPFKLNERCKEIIDYLTNETIAKFRFNYRNGIKENHIEISGKIVDICRILYPNRDKYSVSEYKRAIKYLLNIACFRFSYTKGNRLSNIAFIESLNLTSELKELKSEVDFGKLPTMFSLSIGDAILKNVLAGNLNFVITNQLEEIENPLGKLLYATFRTDRIYDLSTGINSHPYSLIQLQMAASVSGRKSVKVKKYTEAINHLIDKGIVVQSFNMIDNVFKVEWKPLTDVEGQDILQETNLTKSFIGEIVNPMSVY
jgi:hypothetical protein